MFILRIAGDVRGRKRNIEVTFPRRPSLQQICTVAETILPLTCDDDRRPWRPPGPLNGTSPFSSAGLIAPAPRPHATPAQDFCVESVAFLNPATEQWEEVYSASQLPSGAQVYCFCPLEQRRVVVVVADSDANNTAPQTHGDAQHRSSSAGRQSLPVVTAVRDQLVNVDRPGAIPEPQQRLVWDCETSTLPRTRDPAPHDDSCLLSRSQQSRSSAAVNTSRNLGDTSMDNVGYAASSPRRVSSASPHVSADSPSAVQPSYLWTERSEPRSSGRVDTRVDKRQYSFLSNYRYSATGSMLSFTPHHDRRNLTDGHSGHTEDQHATGSSSFVESYRRSGWPSARMSRETKDVSFESSVGFGEAASVLLVCGDGGNRYAHLGERLALLFDVLVHLDTQEGGVERRYLLLRDFYLFASSLALASTTYRHARGSAVPPSLFDLSAELARQFGWTWDDLLRTADADRDGCIAYREWIAFGIEHPDVVQLLCHGARRLPLQVNAALRRLGSRGSSSSAVSEGAPRTPMPSAHLDSGAPESSPSASATSFPCRIHSSRSGEEVEEKDRSGRDGEPEDRPEYGVAFWEGRCEACRELAAQSPEERQQWAAKPKPFVKTLRQ